MKIYIITHTDTSHWKRKGNISQSPDSRGRRWEDSPASTAALGGLWGDQGLVGNPRPHPPTLCSLGSHCSQPQPPGLQGGTGTRRGPWTHAAVHLRAQSKPRICHATSSREEACRPGTFALYLETYIRESRRQARLIWSYPASDESPTPCGTPLALRGVQRGWACPLLSCPQSHGDKMAAPTSCGCVPGTASSDPCQWPI